MRRRAAFLLLVSLVIAPAVATAAEQRFNAGFIALPGGAQSPPMGVWYPSNSVETEGKLGPFVADWAWQGATANGIFPLIILSHGRSGRYRNHRQTAATLARHGYIVLAPEHARDAEMTSARTFVPLITHRAAELKIAWSAIQAHPMIGKIADLNRLGAVGYSLGTITALYAGGSTPQVELVRQHCTQHYEKDINFCGDDWRQKFFARIRATVAWLQAKGVLKPQPKNTGQNTQENPNAAEFSPLAAPLHFSAIALVAPVGAPFSRAAMQQQNAKLALFRLGDDQLLRYPYHAEYLHTQLGDKAHVYKTFAQVHHHAFISPFPQWLLEMEEISVAMDPENFNRADFIRRINNDIVDFFNHHL